MKKTFFDFFPTPKFLEPTASGLSLSGSSISFISFLKEGDHRLSLKGFDRVEIPTGVIENGEIRRPEDLVAILSEFRKKNNLHFVRVNLPEEKAFLFRVTIPKVSYREAREAIQFKIEENVPVSADEALFDFFVMEEGGGEQKVVVSVLPKQVAYDYLDVLKRSGLSPVLFEVESQAIARSVVREGDKDPFLVVNVEKDRVGLYAIEKGLVQFTSTLNLNKEFFKNFDKFPQKTENVSPADQLSGGITIRTTQTEENKTLKDEIEKLLSYWSSFGSSSNSAFKVKKIITCGDSVLEPGFKRYFSSYFDLPVQAANVWVNAFPIENYIPALPYEESFKYAAAIGLALPDSESKRQAKSSKKFIHKKNQKNV